MRHPRNAVCRFVHFYVLNFAFLCLEPMYNYAKTIIHLRLSEYVLLRPASELGAADQVNHNIIEIAVLQMVYKTPITGNSAHNRKIVVVA